MSLKFYEEVVHFVSECVTSPSNFAEHISIFSQNTSQYFRRAPFSSYAGHIAVVLQEKSQLVFRTPCSIL